MSNLASCKENNPLNARPFSLGSNPDICGNNFMHEFFILRIDKGNIIFKI